MNDPFAGMHWMLVTPFDNAEEIDTGSIKGVVDKAASTGCVGVVVLGEMGEWRRLLDSERLVVLDHVMSAAGDLKVTVGTTAPSTYVAVERAKEAQRAGAASVMVSPPPLGKPNPDAVKLFYQRIADAIDIPLVVQDFPQASGVHMSPQFVSELADAIPGFQYLKLEDPPTPTKISRIRELTGERLGIFGGLGGVMLLDELHRGGIGAMTGFAYPEVLVEVINLFFDGENQRAMELFNKFLPLILFENQEGINLSIRKEAIKHRGLLTTAKVRHPAGPIDAITRAELLQLIEELHPVEGN
jgi:4-hydroxy-tetrahydrodipicolinate synthase